MNYFSHVNIRYALYAAAALLIGALLFLIEMTSSKRYAPENVLIQVVDGGVPQEDAECFGDVFAGKEQTQKKKLLRALPSLYDFLDSSSFFANTDRGFYLLETELTEYRGGFEIRIVCYTKGLRGVSYVVVNNENQKECEAYNDGRTISC